MPEKEKTEKTEEMRAEEFAQKFRDVGKKTQQIGCALTLLITLPVLGFAFFSWIGGIVGGVIGILIFAAMFAKGK